jgi:hypothetical protein
MLAFGNHTVIGTLCRQSSTEIELGQSGWLARRQGSEKHRSEGLHRGARARHSLRKPVAPRYKNGALLKRQILKMMSWTMSRKICDNKCCSQCHPYANPMQNGPFSLIWSFLSRTIVRSIDWSIGRPCLCFIHFKTL